MVAGMSRSKKRKAYPSDVSDEEWAFAKPYLSLLPEKSGQREHSLREVFNGAALHRARRVSVALAAQRPAALGGGLPADAPLAGRGGLRGHAPRPARALARGPGAKAGAQRGHFGRAHRAEHPGERRARATTGTSDPRGPRPMQRASASRWSSCPRPRRASCFCPSAGW